jgi:hypothetical protein
MNWTVYKNQLPESTESDHSGWILTRNCHWKNGRALGKLHGFVWGQAPAGMGNVKTKVRKLEWPEETFWDYYNNWKIREKSWKEESHGGGAPNSIYKLCPKLEFCHVDCLLNNNKNKNSSGKQNAFPIFCYCYLQGTTYNPNLPFLQTNETRLEMWLKW